MPKANLCEESMSWSWSNPSPEEASDAYSYYKRQYNNAASQKRASQRQENNYINQKNAARTQMNEAKSQKINFEKRLRGIEKIIGMLEGRDGWGATDCPDEINSAKSKLSKTEESFRKSIVLDGATQPKNLEDALEVKTVEAHTASASALQQFKNEKVRLEQEIARLNAMINNLASTISTLTSKINACNVAQFNLQSRMNSYAYDMNHYRRYMY